MNKVITTIDSEEVSKFAELASQWWNRDGPLKTLHDINPARLEFMLKFISFSNQRILDVGCGGGILSESMALSGAKVTGLDVERDAIASASAHAQETGINIEYVCSPVEEYKSLEFDVITCMEMLEHTSKPEYVIEQCARLLKKGGYLFLSTINRTFKAYAMAVVAAEYILELLPRQTHEFTKFIKPSELAEMVRKAGLEITGIAGMAYNPFTRKASLQESVAVNYLMACRKI